MGYFRLLQVTSGYFNSGSSGNNARNSVYFQQVTVLQVRQGPGAFCLSLLLRPPFILWYSTNNIKHLNNNMLGSTPFLQLFLQLFNFPLRVQRRRLRAEH